MHWHLLIQRPLPLDTPTPIKDVRIQEKAEYRCCNIDSWRRLTCHDTRGQAIQTYSSWHQWRRKLKNKSPQATTSSWSRPQDVKQNKARAVKHSWHGASPPSKACKGPRSATDGRKRRKEIYPNHPQSACMRSMRCLVRPAGWADEAQMPEAWRERPELHQRGPPVPHVESHLTTLFNAAALGD